MTIEEKIEMINQICNGLKESLIHRVVKIPDNWDGVEIKQWISDYYNTNYNYFNCNRNKWMNNKRKHNYRNDLMTISDLI